MLFCQDALFVIKWLRQWRWLHATVQSNQISIRDSECRHQLLSELTPRADKCNLMLNSIRRWQLHWHSLQQGALARTNTNLLFNVSLCPCLLFALVRVQSLCLSCTTYCSLIYVSCWSNWMIQQDRTNGIQWQWQAKQNLLIRQTLSGAFQSIRPAQALVSLLDTANKHTTKAWLTQAAPMA